MELTKKLKADIFCEAVNRGWWYSDDKCEWVPHLHKYRYYCADEECTYYVTQKDFAENFDDVLDDEDRDQMIEDYFGMGDHTWNI